MLLDQLPLLRVSRVWRILLDRAPCRPQRHSLARLRRLLAWDRADCTLRYSHREHVCLISYSYAGHHLIRLTDLNS